MKVVLSPFNEIIEIEKDSTILIEEEVNGAKKCLAIIASYNENESKAMRIVKQMAASEELLQVAEQFKIMLEGQNKQNTPIYYQVIETIKKATN